MNEQFTVLVIDDDITNLRHIQMMLKVNGYLVAPMRSGAAALKYLEQNTPDIIMLDVEMPEMDGYEVLKRLKGNPAWSEIPVIFLTGREDTDSEIKALEMGAVDYLQKPVLDKIVSTRLKMHLELETYRKKLSHMVDQKTKALEQKNFVLRNMQEVIISMLAHLTEFRDQETGGHITRTKEYVELLISNLPRFSDFYAEAEYVANMSKASQLHDIGKVAIPDAILLKPGKLTAEEWEIMKSHPLRGANILSEAAHDLGFQSLLDVGREIALGHHEWWNGAGYPNGLKGENIPISARIAAIADVYDALRSVRPYKQAISHEVALEMINSESGTHFDPTIIKVFNHVHKKFQEIFDSVH